VGRVDFNTLYASVLAIMKSNRIYIFIDASNLWQAQKVKGRFFDFEKTIAYIKSTYSGSEVKVFYYTAYPAQGTRSYSLDSKHNFYTFLKKGLGFVVRKKELKRITKTDEHGESIVEKGNMDVELTIDAVHHAKSFDTALFFSGDSDFLGLVTYLRSRGKKVYIFSSRNNISQELRTGADGYVDVLDLEEDIWGKELKHRA